MSMPEKKLDVRSAWERPHASQRMTDAAYDDYCERKEIEAVKPIPEFIPVGEELHYLIRHWLHMVLDISWCWWLGQVGGGSEHARWMFANERLDDIERAIGQEAFEDAFEAAV